LANVTSVGRLSWQTGNFIMIFLLIFETKQTQTMTNKGYSKISIADPNPLDPHHHNEKLKSNPHQSQNSGAMEDHNGALEGRRRSH
jgi:hypothetical protein